MKTLREKAREILEKDMPLIQRLALGGDLYSNYELVEDVDRPTFTTASKPGLFTEDVYSEWKPHPDMTQEAIEELKKFHPGVPIVSPEEEHPCGQCAFKGMCYYLYGKKGETCPVISKGLIYIRNTERPWTCLRDIHPFRHDWFRYRGGSTYYLIQEISIDHEKMETIVKFNDNFHRTVEQLSNSDIEHSSDLEHWENCQTKVTE